MYKRQTVIGALFGSLPSNRLGRKKTLSWIGFFFFISAVGSALALSPYTFSFFRFIGGIAVGVSSVTAPIYISEMTKSENRGSLGVLYQFSLVFGILIAFISNYLLTGFDGDNDWRWMLGVEAIPAFIYFLLTIYLPESPRWLILFKNDDLTAKKVLKEIYLNQIEADAVLKSIKLTDNDKLVENKLFIPRFKKTVILAFLISFFNQLSGINFILYYAPEILEMGGFATKESLFNSVICLLYTSPSPRD